MFKESATLKHRASVWKVSDKNAGTYSLSPLPFFSVVF